MDYFEKFGPWILAALGLIFQAGILYAASVAMRRDMNGIGKKVRGIQEQNEQRYLTIVILSLLEDVPKEHHHLYLAKAQLFLNAAKGRNL
jgi:hypothetical protein